MKEFEQLFSDMLARLPLQEDITAEIVLLEKRLSVLRQMLRCHNGSDVELISGLGVSFRIERVLGRMGIETVGDLMKRSEDDLLSQPYFGNGSLLALRLALAKRGLTLETGVTS